MERQRLGCLHQNQADGLANWAAVKSRYGDEHRGPLYPAIGDLAPTQSGNPRFYVDAGYAQGFGATIGKQLSIWEWNGSEAIPLLMKDYAYMIDQEPLVMEGNLLRVRTKESYKTMFSCGSCPEAEADWRIRVTPQDIEDLGSQRLVPEMETVDELFDRVAHHLPASDLTTKEVVAKLTQDVDELPRDVEFPDISIAGMLMDWKLHHNDRGAKLCLETDKLPKYLFTLIPSGAAWFATDITVLGQDGPIVDCKTAVSL